MVMEMFDKLFQAHNIEGRIERAPLGALSYLLNTIGIIGNALVIHIFRTRFTTPSNYRVFVLFLAVVDIFLCITHVARELNRMLAVYSQVEEKGVLICKIAHYIGNSVSYSSIMAILFIGIERYRKICTPFKSQITIKLSTILCALSVLIGFVVNIPIYLINGRRYVVVESINATRCAVKNEYDGVLLPILFYAYRFVDVLVILFFIITFQVKILKALAKKVESKQKMKNMAKANETGSGVSDSKIRKQNRNEVKKEKETAFEVVDSAEQQETEKNRKIAKTFAIVTLLLVATYAFNTLFMTIQATRRYLEPRQKISKSEDVMEEYAPDIITFNGILNPFVYFFTDIQFNQELKKLCGRKV